MKKALCLIIAVLMMFSILAACSGDTSGDTSGSSSVSTSASASVSTSGNTTLTYTPFEGENVFDAVEWAAENFPDATVIRYANNTSTAAYESNGGAIPAVCLYLAEELPVRTEGRYRLEIYPDGVLASGVDDVIAGLREDTFEMNSLTAGNWASYTDAFSEVNVPFIFESYDQADAALKAGLLDDMYKKAEEDIDGILFMGINSLGFRQLTNNAREVTSPAEVSGLKIRTLSDPIQISAWEALGASVTTMSYSELYTSLQQGVIDGEENPAQNLWNDKLYEVQKYCTITNHLYSVSCQCVSEDFFNGMSAEDQQILTQLIDEAQDVGFERIKELDDGFIKNCQDAGMQVTYLTDEQMQAFKDTMNSVYDTCIQTMGQDRWDALQKYASVS
ncbi:MAG: TRAP transporter substrate-binding protein [Oscillospiraceae bacterium]